MIATIGLGIFLYLLLRLLLPLQVARSWRVVFAVLLLLLCSKFYWLGWLGGSFFNPELPRWVLIASAWVSAWLLLLLFACLLIDVLIVLRWLCGLLLRAWGCGRALARWRFGMHRVGKCSALLLATAVLAAWGCYEGLRCPDVKEKKLLHEDVAVQHQGLRVVLLSDLHLSALQRAAQVKQIVARVNALRPDLVLISGDLADGSVQLRMPAVRELAHLSAKYGVWVSPGNHEYYSGYAEWRKTWQQLGFGWLENANAKINIKGADLVLAGVSDPQAARVNLPGPRVAAALKGVKDSHFCMVMAHQPRVVRDLLGSSADVVFSGHTHGGMMWGVDYLTAKANAGLVRGWYHLQHGNGKTLRSYVSSGTHQWAGFVCRLGVPAEITLFELARP